MPSNKELKKSITDAAEKLGVDAPNTDGMSNSKLAETLSELKNREPIVEALVEALEPGIPVIAEGKALTTKRGILGPGEPIVPEDLAGGEEAFEALVENGYVVEG